jgi:hypothetical protein
MGISRYSNPDFNDHIAMQMWQNLQHKVKQISENEM